MSRHYANDYGGAYGAQGYGGYSDSGQQQQQGAAAGAYGAAPYRGASPSPTAYTSSPLHQRPLQPDNYSGTTAVAGGGNNNNNSTSNVSPFESVFDDHVYPANTRQQNPPDTTYYGSGGRSDDNLAGDSIPLRDRAAAAKGVDMPDHVYDIPQPDQARSRPKDGRVRFGELGMLGSSRKRIPFVVYLLTLAQAAVFIGEVVKNGIETGSPIMIHPQFNPMIGPSTYILINMGARFVPCMHNVKGVQSATETISWPCPNTTTSNAECTLSQLCGFSGVPEPFYNGTANQSPEPNQWFRFIVPVFLHAGLIHIGFNMLLQLTLGRDMERAIGSIRFFLVYMSAGIFGFIMGGNYAATGIASTGASGSLFGIIALTLLDLLYSWRDRRNPVKDLMFILLDVVISFVLGLLPGLDNFSHIGGFLMGIVLGICVLHSPNALRRRIGDEDPSYSSVSDNNNPTTANTYNAAKPLPFFRNPVGFFQGRKPLWWAWWLLRAGAVVLVIVVYVVLLRNFYEYHKTCGWCKYLSCLPVNNWCEIGTLQLSNSSTKRDVLMSAPRLTNLF